MQNLEELSGRAIVEWSMFSLTHSKLRLHVKFKTKFNQWPWKTFSDALVACGVCQSGMKDACHSEWHEQCMQCFNTAIVLNSCFPMFSLSSIRLLLHGAVAIPSAAVLMFEKHASTELPAMNRVTLLCPSGMVEGRALTSKTSSIRHNQAW